MPKQRKVAAGRTPAQRRQARQHLGPLRENRIALATRLRYQRAVHLFLRFNVITQNKLAASLEELDLQLAEFIEH